MSEQDHTREDKPSDLNYETSQMSKKNTDDIAGKNSKIEHPAADGKADQTTNPPKKDDSNTHSSKEMMGEDIQEDGSMPRY